MMKNSEWATAAYLSHSKYGKNSEVLINSNSSYITGGGTGEAYVSNVSQSTTGNITGIYDMSGGSWEYTMSSYGTNENTVGKGLSGFSNLPESKYYDIMYKADTLLGHAMSETVSWYGDFHYYVISSTPWIIRGGSGYSTSYDAGLFNFSCFSGCGFSAFSFRPVFVPAE